MKNYCLQATTYEEDLKVREALEYADIIVIHALYFSEHNNRSERVCYWVKGTSETILAFCLQHPARVVSE
jgi:hypothetical protein